MVSFAGMDIQRKSVYISRNLQPQSAFRQILESRGVAVEGQSLIRFQPVPFTEVPEADWVFFYSPRAVRLFLSYLPHPLSSELRIGSIGPSTAQVLADMGCKTNFIGTGEPEATAAAFMEVAAMQRVLFPQARNSRQSVQKQLGAAIHAIDLIVYDNELVEDFPLRRSEVLVFTSPLNAKAYLGRYPVLPEQYLVAIGKPTASACRSFGKEPVVSSAPNERALAIAALGCLEAGGK